MPVIAVTTTMTTVTAADNDNGGRISSSLMRDSARLPQDHGRLYDSLARLLSRKVGLARTCETLVSQEVSSRKVGLARSLVLAKNP